jgi:hypothetical protein
VTLASAHNNCGNCCKDKNCGKKHGCCEGNHCHK